MKELPNLTVLRQFVEIDNAGGIARAARNMGLSQSAISKNMRRLELSVGADLFARHTRGTQLTAAGLGFLRHAKRSLLEYEHAVELARAHATTGTGTLRVGAGYVFTTQILPLVLPILRQGFPNHRVKVRTVTTEDLSRELELQRIDLAVHAITEKSDAMITRRPLLPARRGVLCSTDHPLAKLGTSPIRIQDVVEYPFVSPELGNPELLDLERIAYRHNVKPLDISVECDSISGALKLLEDSRHLMFASTVLAGSPVARDIIALPLDVNLGEYAIGFSYRADYKADAYARAFMSVVRQALEKMKQRESKKQRSARRERT